MVQKDLLIGKYRDEIKNIILDCKIGEESISKIDIESVNMLLSALEIFASQEGLSGQEWCSIVLETTQGIPGSIRFRPTVA